MEKRVYSGTAFQFICILLLYSKMQNFNSAKWASGASSPPSRGQEDFQKIFHRLKDLHEIQDQSRNELCPVFLDEQSLIKSRRESNWSSHQAPTQVNILKELEETSQLYPQDHQQPKPSNRRSTYQPLLDQDLRQSNRKLQEDNRKLLNECVRLRQICKVNGSKDDPFKKKEGRDTNPVFDKLDLQNRSLKQQIEELKVKNLNLEQKLKIFQQQLASQQIIANKYDRIRAELEQIQRVNEQLTSKVLSLENELEAANTRSTSKSSQSISMNNSTQQSRKTEVEKDRMIINMKIVHESQKLKLKNIIEQLKRQLSKNGQQSSFSNLVNLKKK